MGKMDKCKNGEGKWWRTRKWWTGKVMKIRLWTWIKAWIKKDEGDNDNNDTNSDENDYDDDNNGDFDTTSTITINIP